MPDAEQAPNRRHATGTDAHSLAPRPLHLRKRRRADRYLSHCCVLYSSHAEMMLGPACMTGLQLLLQVGSAPQAAPCPADDAGGSCELIHSGMAPSPEHLLKCTSLLCRVQAAQLGSRTDAADDLVAMPDHSKLLLHMCSLTYMHTPVPSCCMTLNGRSGSAHTVSPNAPVRSL